MDKNYEVLGAVKLRWGRDKTCDVQDCEGVAEFISLTLSLDETEVESVTLECAPCNAREVEETMQDKAGVG